MDNTRVAGELVMIARLLSREGSSVESRITDRLLKMHKKAERYGNLRWSITDDIEAVQKAARRAGMDVVKYNWGGMDMIFDVDDPPTVGDLIS